MTVKLWPRLLVFLWVLAIIACRESYSAKDPVLGKPVEELTDEEIARMVAVVKTTYGEFRFELHPEWGPKTARHFIRMTRMGLYAGQTVNEARPNTWVLIGDPKENPQASGFSIEVEEDVPTPGSHFEGTVGLYHPDGRKDLGGSRFYVMLKDRFIMDGGYTPFGKIIEGMAVVKRIGAVQTTCELCQPAPYIPLSPINILDVHLEVRRAE